jgi:hypothetical protein
MPQKKIPVKNKGTSGGAAAAAGISFQQSVAALAMTHAALDLKDYPLLGIVDDFGLKSIHLETPDVIDDVVLIGRANRILIQAKRTVALSDLPTSEYSSALKQFVTHHFTARADNDRYILATSTRSSDRIIFDLRKLTESVRLNANALQDNPLTEKEIDVVTKTHKLISHHISTVFNRPALQSEIDEVFASIWVLPLDLDSGGRDEFTAITLLRSRSKVPPKLVWAVLLTLARSLAEQRTSVDIKGLRERVDQYLFAATQTKTFSDEFKFQLIRHNNMAAGKEVLIFDKFLGTDGYSIAEFSRFGTDGIRRIKFKGNDCILSDGSTHQYIYRSATMIGTTRFLEANLPLFENDKVTILPYTGDDNLDDSPWAKIHAELLDSKIHEKANFLTCLSCGDPISENKATLIEVDEEGHQGDIGFVHGRCHQARYRVLGELQSELFSKYSALIDFDFESWILANKFGPGILFSKALPAATARIAWKHGVPPLARGKWCIQILLDDGGSHYVTERGKVHRFGSDKISSAVEFINGNIAEGIKRRDPCCVTPDHSIFGTFSTIAPSLKVGERPLKWKEAKAVEFTSAIDEAYSSKQNYYAPLTVLINRETGEPLIMDGGAIFILSSPLDLATSIDNWRDAGMRIFNYGVSIIKNDAEFDAFAQSSLRSDVAIIIDPFLDLKGNLLKGYVVESFGEMFDEDEKI